MSARFAWMGSALCAQTDPDLFGEAASGTGTRAPKRICGQCPVAPECAAHEQALREHQGTPLHGVWAGLSRRQRSDEQRHAA